MREEEEEEERRRSVTATSLRRVLVHALSIDALNLMSNGAGQGHGRCGVSEPLESDPGRHARVHAPARQIRPNTKHQSRGASG